MVKVIFFLFATAFSNPSNIELISQVETKYKNLKNLNADLEKTSKNNVLKNTKTYYGTILFSKKKMKIVFSKPFKSEVLFNSDVITTVQYPEDPEFDNKIRVIKTKVSDFLGLILSGNFSKMKVLSKAKKDGATIFELVPKKFEGIKQAKVTIDPEKLLITNLSYTDNLDNKTSFEFKNIKLNKKTKKDAFKLTIPKDAEVVEL